MTTTVSERFSYHPEPGARADRGGRRVESRRDAIAARMDLKGKSMVDFGCSGGYFGFAWASELSRYLGIDGDGALIERNAKAAAERGLTHLEFRHDTVTPELVRALPKADVGLFLSVFHHILAVSSAYAWNAPTAFDPWEIVRAMRERLDVLVFEIGYPTEGFEWCARLPPMRPDPRSWVTERLKEVGFRYVEVIPSREIYGPASVVRRVVAEKSGIVARPRALVSRALQRVVRHDPRDDRDIFIAR